MLHASEPNDEGKNKIEPFVNSLTNNFRPHFYPYECLSLDKMVIGFQWRLRSRQYNSKKRHKYHIKTFSLCDSITGYSLNILIYFGQETTFNLHIDENLYADSQAVKIFDKLLERYSGRHHLFADRFYTSISLIQYLESKHFNLTGTINMQRRFFPQELKRNNVNHRY